MAEEKTRLTPAILRRLHRVDGEDRLRATAHEIGRYAVQDEQLKAKAMSIAENWIIGQRKHLLACQLELEEILITGEFTPCQLDSIRSEQYLGDTPEPQLPDKSGSLSPAETLPGKD